MVNGSVGPRVKQDAERAVRLKHGDDAEVYVRDPTVTPRRIIVFVAVAMGDAPHACYEWRTDAQGNGGDLWPCP